MKRFQGRSAEKAFSKLCSDKGVTCNDSVEDDYGWDHIVEFPHDSLPGVPADMQRPTPAVFVQTKSHAAKGLKVTMKLSNAVKLARSPSPAFVVLRTSAEAEDGGEQVWYAIHFWDPLIARTLKRARQASRDGISENDFHKYDFSFTMTGSDRRTDDELLPWIKSTVRSLGNDYATAKRALHPGPQIVGTVRFGALDSIEQLVDHQLGLVPNIPVESVTINLRRFGVDLPLPIPVPTGAPIHFSMQSNPTDQCDIRMRGPDGSTIEVVGDIIVPGLPGLPEDQRKLRIRGPMFDIILSFSGAMAFTAHFDADAKWTPTELEKMVRFFSWSGEGEIDLRVTIRDDPLFSGTGSLDSMKDQRMFAALVEQIGMLAQLSAHLTTKRPQISVADFLEAENVFNLYRFIHGTDMKLNMKLFEDQPFAEVDEAVASGAACVGDWIFGIIQRFPIIQQQRSGDQIALAFGAPLVLQTYAFLAKDAIALGHFEADFERYMCKKGVLGISNVLSNFDKSNGTSSNAYEQG